MPHSAPFRGHCKGLFVVFFTVTEAYQIQTSAPWNLAKIDNSPIRNEYKFSALGTGVDIYVIDSGLDLRHPELVGNAELHLLPNAKTYDFDNPNLKSDCTGHGTHVASVAAGRIHGVAKNATIHMVKVQDCEAATISGLVEAVEWVTERVLSSSGHRPAIMNLSVGLNTTSNQEQLLLMDLKLREAIDANITVIQAAGNGGRNACQNRSPAGALILVGATGFNDEELADSNYGECLTVYAPGEDIIGAWALGTKGKPDKDDAIMNTGTSQAAPHVAGVAAIILEKSPWLTPLEVKHAIMRLAVPLASQVIPNRFLRLPQDDDHEEELIDLDLGRPLSTTTIVILAVCGAGFVFAMAFVAVLRRRKRTTETNTTSRTDWHERPSKRGADWSEGTFGMAKMSPVFPGTDSRSRRRSQYSDPSSRHRTGAYEPRRRAKSLTKDRIIPPSRAASPVAATSGSRAMSTRKQHSPMYGYI